MGSRPIHGGAWTNGILQRLARYWDQLCISFDADIVWYRKNERALEPINQHFAFWEKRSQIFSAETSGADIEITLSALYPMQ